MVSFNVLREPWIPAVDHEGRPHDLGILGVLHQAHELAEIIDPSPPIEYGIYRLLVAFVMDAYNIQELEDIEGLLAAGSFDIERINAYVDECGDCFDLFHPERPFLQTAVTDGALKPVSELVQHLPSGTFATHFHHSGASAHSFAPAACVRLLTAIPPFMTAGGAGYSPSINGMPPWYVLICGENVFETLLLNASAMPAPWSMPELNLPAWRDDSSFSPKREVSRFGLLSGLTWRPRSVRLIAGDGGRCTYTGVESEYLVREMHFGPGLRAVNENGAWTDPSVSYRTTKNGRSPLRPEEGRELWRDTGPLTLLQQQEHHSDEVRVRFTRPMIVTQFEELQEREAIPAERPLHIDCYGLRTDGKMKIFEWQHERLQLPASVLHNPRSAAQVQTAMDTAGRVESYMKRAMKKAYPRDGDGNAKAFDNLIVDMRQVFWSSLCPRFGQEYLERLATQDVNDPEAPALLMKFWTDALRQEGAAALDYVLDQLDADAQAIRRQVAARGEFWKRFGRLALEVPNPENAEAQTTEDN